MKVLPEKTPYGDYMGAIEEERQTVEMLAFETVAGVTKNTYKRGERPT